MAGVSTIMQPCLALSGFMMIVMIFSGQLVSAKEVGQTNRRVKREACTNPEGLCICSAGLIGCTAQCTAQDVGGERREECSCSAGFTLAVDGITCVNIDECATGASTCTCGGLLGCLASCTNTIGSYTCSCSVGYTLDLDGITCIDLDECVTGTSTCTCGGLPGCLASCTNTIGSYTCSCSDGYTLDLDGITCIEFDECVTGTSTCTCGGLPGCITTCTNTIGSYTCSCSDGFKLGSDLITCIVDRVRVTGNTIVASQSGSNNTGAIFLLRPSVQTDSVLFAFQAYHRSKSPYVLQIWRPADNNQHTLIWQTDVTPSVSDGVEDIYLSSSRQPSCVRLNIGDRIGYYVRTVPGAVAYYFDSTDPNSQAYTVDSDNFIPSVGAAVTFDALSFPYRFSLAAYSDIDVDKYKDRQDLDNGYVKCLKGLKIPGSDVPKPSTTTVETTDITVESTSVEDPGDDSDDGGNDVGLIIGILLAVVIVILLVTAVLVYLLWYRRRNQKSSIEHTTGVKNPVYTANGTSDASDDNAVNPDTSLYVNVNVSVNDTTSPSLEYQELGNQNTTAKHTYAPLNPTTTTKGSYDVDTSPDKLYVNEAANEPDDGTNELTYENEGGGDGNEQELTYENEGGDDGNEQELTYENEGGDNRESQTKGRVVSEAAEPMSPDNYYDYVETRVEPSFPFPTNRAPTPTPTVQLRNVTPERKQQQQYAERVPSPDDVDRDDEPQTPSLYENVDVRPFARHQQGSSQQPSTDGADNMYLQVTDG